MGAEVVAGTPIKVCGEPESNAEGEGKGDVADIAGGNEGGEKGAGVVAGTLIGVCGKPASVAEGEGKGV